MTASYLTESGSTSPENATTPPREVAIYDVTLRDGEQQAGVVFSKAHKLEIFAALDDAGVPVIETGMIAASPEEAEIARAVLDTDHRAKVYVLCRALAGDIDQAASVGVDGITLETIANAAVAEKVFGWGPDDPRKKARAALARASDNGLPVNLFFIDATRVEADRLAELAVDICRDARPQTLTVADTFGVATGEAVASYVKALTDAVGLPVYVHCHNDYGLAVANTCAGIEAGAFGAHVSVNGMGERAGNAALEDVVMVGRGPYRWQTGVDPKRLTALSRLVADRSDSHPAPNKSVVGARIFGLESGVAAAFYEQLRNDDLGHFYAYLPAALDQQPVVLVGKGSGAANLRLRAETVGSDELRDRAAALLPEAKARATQKLGLLSDDELLRMVAECS